ncbi:MAG: hypothetical protein AAGH15_08905 [Myxococcota bacterium]
MGVCLQSPGYPLRRLVDGVAFIDSGTPPVESTGLAVPDPSRLVLPSLPAVPP